jgi:hypothetical protein
MTDDETPSDSDATAPNEAVDEDTGDDANAGVTTPDDPAADPEPKAARDGVHVPQWLAAALVVLLGFAIGVGGFAVGRATADDNGRRLDNPALIRSRGSQTNGPNGNDQQNGPGFGRDDERGSRGGSQDGDGEDEDGNEQDGPPDNSFPGNPGGGPGF